jgi:hypothetical protein
MRLLDVLALAVEPVAAIDAVARRAIKSLRICCLPRVDGLVASMGEDRLAGRRLLSQNDEGR